MSAPTALLVLWTGCTFITPDEIQERTDPDGDGVLLSEDCDPEDPAVGGPSTWFVDLDGDGHGDPSTEQVGCPSLVGVAVGDDCDDADATVWPGAEEICDDRVVNDCESDADAAWERCGWTSSVNVTTEALALLGDSAADAAGTAVDAGADLDQDGHADLLVGAPGVSLYRGAAYIVLGPLDEADYLEKIGLRLDGDGLGDLGGFAVAVVGSVDGDAYPDIGVGAPARGATDLDDCRGGTFYLMAGPPAAGELADADATFSGPDGAGCTGHALGPAGDLDGDRQDEVVVGSPALGSSGTGRVWVLPGADLAAGEPEEGAVALVGEEGSFLGYRIASGADIGGDGLPDLVIGAPGGEDWSGRVYLVEGAAPSELDLDAAAVLIAEERGDYLGNALVVVGDADGDGYDDVAVGATASDQGALNGGAVYLLLGPVTGGSASVGTAAAARVVGGDEDDQLGFALAAPGDVNGDGLADLLTGAPGADRFAEGAGMVALALAPLEGLLGVSEVGPAIGAPGEDLNAGRALDAFEEDGVHTLIIGVPGANDESRFARGVGAAWVLDVPGY